MSPLTVYFMRLFTLLAGYAAWLAIAMKVRRDAGQSKLDQNDPSKSPLEKLVDEVKDIHTSTYHDVRSYVGKYLSDVHDFESLKTKVTSMIESVAIEAETFVADLQKKWMTKQEEIHDQVDAFIDEKEALLEEAKAKGVELTDTTTDTVISWIDGLKSRLLQLRNDMKSRLDTSTPGLPEKTTSRRKGKAPDTSNQA